MCFDDECRLIDNQNVFATAMENSCTLFLIELINSTRMPYVMIFIILHTLIIHIPFKAIPYISEPFCKSAII